MGFRAKVEQVRKNASREIAAFPTFLRLVVKRSRDGHPQLQNIILRLTLFRRRSGHGNSVGSASERTRDALNLLVKLAESESEPGEGKREKGITSSPVISRFAGRVHWQTSTGHPVRYSRGSLRSRSSDQRSSVAEFSYVTFKFCYVTLRSRAAKVKPGNPAGVVTRDRGSMSREMDR